MSVDHTLIAGIYRSVGEANPLTTALDQIALRYGAKAGSIIMNDFAEPTVSGLFLGSLYQQPDVAALISQFMQKFASDEQVVIQKIGARNERFSFISDEDGYGLPASEIPANNWNRKNLGVNRRYAARLSLTPAWFDVFSLHFPNHHLGLTQSIENDIKDYLIHFSTALEMVRPFRLLEARFKAISAVLDKLKVGIALVTASGEITLNNKRFDDILQQQDGISLTRQGTLRFSATNDAEKGRFSKYLKGYCAGIYPNEDQTEFVFSRESEKIGYVASLCPLGAMIAGAAEASNMAVLIVKDPNSKDEISVDLVKKLCALTKVEAEICMMLVNGKTINQIAEHRNVHQSTTRNQVASIFAKTGSKSQSQLIRFALNVDLPVELPSDP